MLLRLFTSWRFRPLWVVGVVLLAQGCANERLVLADTESLGSLGELRLGMSRAEARRIADRHATRSERLSCSSHRGDVYCERMGVPIGSDGNLRLRFRGDTLRELSWTRSEDFASLRRRYAGFGEPQWARVGRPPRPADIIAVWLSADSTVIRDAVCHDGRSRPACKIVAASTTPAGVRARAAKETARRRASAYEEMIP